MRTPLSMLVLVVGSILAQPPAVEWKPFSSKEANFTALMPGTPAEFKKPIDTAIGKGEVLIYQVILPPGDKKYSISCSEYPEAAIKPGSEDKRLDNAREGAVTSAKGKLKREKTLLLHDMYPGREVHIEIAGKASVVMRMYAVKNRLYEIVAVGTPDFVTSQETAKLFDSFKLGH